jgi:biopolymer transport protein ExbB/TolQ
MSAPAIRPEIRFTAEFEAERQDNLFYTVLAFVLAFAETLVLYVVTAASHGLPLLESVSGQVHDPGLPWLFAVLVSRGPLQPLNLCIFGFGANLLVLRFWNMRKESLAFDHPYFHGIPVNEQKQFVITEEFRKIPLGNVVEIGKRYTGFRPLLVRRLEVGSRRLAEQGDASQVHDVMGQVAEIDRETLESRYTLIRYLIWLIPTIGFLGTVIGIGRAIAGFTGFLSKMGHGDADFQTQLQPVLSTVSGELGIAFDVTALALFLSSIIVAMTSVVQTREETLLTRIDEFCLRYFISRIAVVDFATNQMGLFLQRAITALASRDGSADRGILGHLEAQTERLSELKGIHAEALKALQGAAQAIASSVDRIAKQLPRG